MTTYEPPPAQQPDEAPEQTPQPKPERQPRRRTISPVFRASDGRIGRPGKGVFMALVMGLFTLGAAAQTTPATPVPAPATTPATAPQQPTTQGWTMFDDGVGRELQLPAERMQRLMDMDARYQKDYSALGTEPWTNKGYGDLSTRRNAETRSILTPTEYDRWNTRYNTPPLPPPPPGDTPRR